MGGLRKKMPVTYLTMLASTLAIAGIPLFAGFYSKDGIIMTALARADVEGSFLYTLPAVFLIAAAAMTAFYMFRLIFMTFHGEPRDKEKYDHAHESGPSMAIPLIVLGLGAVFVGNFWPAKIAKGEIGKVLEGVRPGSSNSSRRNRRRSSTLRPSRTRMARCRARAENSPRPLRLRHLLQQPMPAITVPGKTRCTRLTSPR